MSYKGISVVMASIILLLFIPLKITAQETGTVGESNTLAADTIDYIPVWYPGALEYNLMIASARGLSSEIDRLIQKGANINSYNTDGATPLIFAVSYNKPEAVRTLLKYSPDLEEFTSGWETALMIAVKKWHRPGLHFENHPRRAAVWDGRSFGLTRLLHPTACLPV